jgi:hypothetical protein
MLMEKSVMSFLPIYCYNFWTNGTNSFHLFFHSRTWIRVEEIVMSQQITSSDFFIAKRADYMCSKLFLKMNSIIIFDINFLDFLAIFLRNGFIFTHLLIDDQSEPWSLNLLIWENICFSVVVTGLLSVRLLQKLIFQIFW